MGFWALVGGLLLNRWVLAMAVAAVAFRYWSKKTIGFCTCQRRLDGLTALVTGANTGIGLETARDLARRGARVLLACRDPERGRKAVELVRCEASRGATVELVSLDLASLNSVRNCAAKILASEPRLDILINNAGAGGLGSKKSEDGLHLGFQVNHFGPFLFTLLLVDLLKRSSPSRIVFVSSVMHEVATLRPEFLDYDCAKKINNFQIYAISKLANILTANELARRLQGTGVTVNSVHPGVVQTDIYRNYPYIEDVMSFLFGFFFKNAEEGAQTTIHVAVAEELEGVSGRYFADCAEKRMAKPAYDQELARAVWNKTEELVKLKDKDFLSYISDKLEEILDKNHI